MKFALKGMLFVSLLIFTCRQGYAQEPYRTTRSPETQQAISHIGQAEYYARMALRSLEASEKAGRAPFFDYKKAQEDLQKILGEFRTYLEGEGSPATAAAVPLVIDGRYFAESIKDYLQKRKADGSEAMGNTPLQRTGGEEVQRKESDAQAHTQRTDEKKNALTDGRAEPKEEMEVILPPPPVQSPGGHSKEEKIEEILKKGL